MRKKSKQIGWFSIAKWYYISRKDLFELLVCLALAGLFVLLSSGVAFGLGNVGINNPTPHAKSLLDLTSNDKGLLPPRRTAAPTSSRLRSGWPR